MYKLSLNTDETTQCSLEDVLVFFSGSDRVPPLGFTSCPCLVFLHNDEILPTASTCALELRLPTAHDDYDKFKDAMILGFIGHDGFGGV